MYHDLTKGNISRSLLLFALPMMAGNLLQQFYNIADTLIVGRVLGRDALAAVGSAYTLMTFLTSIFLGLSLGSGALFSIYKGRGDEKTLKSSVFHAFVLIMAVTVVLNILVYLGLDGILAFLKVPEEVWQGMRQYLLIIFAGLIATSLYNFFACLLRAMGNCTGSTVCGRVVYGDRRCGTGYHYRTVHFGTWYHGFRPSLLSAGDPQKE